MINIEYKRKIYADMIEEDLKKIEERKEQVKVHGERYKASLSDWMRILRYHESCVKYMRENDPLDLEKRKEIKSNYTSLIDKVIPDGVPIVFHGTNNISTVEQILKSGGLLTPIERGESFTSFATQIDVTAKKNIRTSLEFADPNDFSLMPYGAIFAFLPQEYEYEKVLETGMGCEVYNGVASVNFVSEPNRLIGIITTEENISRFKEWCLKYNISPDKVYTHESFITMCNNMDFSQIMSNTRNY